MAEIWALAQLGVVVALVLGVMAALSAMGR